MSCIGCRSNNGWSHDGWLTNVYSTNTRFITTQLPTNYIVPHNNGAMMIGPGDQTGRPYIIIWVSHALQFCNSLLKCKQT